MSGDYCLNETSLPSSIDSHVIPPEEPFVKDITQSFYKLYPNPVRNRLHFEITSEFISDKAIISLFGMRGEKLLSMELYETGNHTFDLSAFPAGLYIVHILKADELFVEKIIKQ